MKTLRLFPTLLAAALALLPLATSHAEETSSIKFSDPAKPGTLRLRIARGDVRIKGSDAAEITVNTDAKPVTRAPRKDGLRVLTASSGFSLTETNNVVTLDTLMEGSHGHGADFTITVPRSTSIVLNSSFGGGDVRCTDIAGDIEIESLHGEVHLDGISGGALVSTMNGEIHATIASVTDKKPLSFSSMNGEVLIRVPADTKANVRLRTQNGQILTNFEEGALVTKVESAPRMPKSSTLRSTGRWNKPSVLPPEAQDAIHEAGRATAEAMRVAQLAVREAAEAAREGMEAARAAEARAPEAPVPPKPPKAPTIPAMTGGKIVTGTLNGGGPEISVATMNGDVTLRKLDPK